MKHSIKKVLSLVVTLAMMITAFSALSITASAVQYVEVALVSDTVFNKSGAKKIESDKTYKGDTSKTALNWYKITTSKAGTLKIDYTTNGENTNLYLFDSNGNYVDRSDIITYSGYVEGYSTEHIFGHSENNKFSTQVSFKVAKSTYYMIICPGWQNTSYGGEFSFKAVFPSDSDTAGDIMYLSTVMEKGDTLKLSAITSGSAKASYSSSKKSVATVDTNGKIKAKGEGTAYITIKCKKTVIKIKVKVVDD